MCIVRKDIDGEECPYCGFAACLDEWMDIEYEQLKAKGEI